MANRLFAAENIQEAAYNELFAGYFQCPPEVRKPVCSLQEMSPLSATVTAPK